MNVIQAMEDVKRHVQTLTVASPVPVQMVLYWIQMALIVMVGSTSVHGDIYRGTRHPWDRNKCVD